MALEAFINGDKHKEPRKRGRTLRFDLELAPPTEESTNEFSYTELVEGDKRKRERVLNLGSGPEAGPDNQLTALAQRLGEKYGAPGPKKRKKQRVFESDLIDRGYGYDTNDSFVDDSEMYEDFVPPQVDTKFGGFYVNTGDLEFTAVSQAGDDEDMDILARQKKKPKMKKQSSHQTPQSILAR
jgi:ubinuclein